MKGLVFCPSSSNLHSILHITKVFAEKSYLGSFLGSKGHGGHFEKIPISHVMDPVEPKRKSTLT